MEKVKWTIQWFNGLFSFSIIIFNSYYCCMCLDDDMIRAGLTPYSETQRTCVRWLENYFTIYGDKDPSRDEIHLSIMARRDVYLKYRKDMIQQQTEFQYPRPFVKESRFCELWNVLFPLCVNRPWCDIPGKCKVCAEIDKLRRTTNFSTVHKNLKEAHHLHRCGMFMLERAK